MQKKILVVDDELALLDLLTDRLTDNGYQVFKASDGLMAVQLAHDENPDLILLDVKMPAGGGTAVYDNLRLSFRTASIPIIFMTAYLSDDLKAKLGRREVKGVFSKPFNMDELLGKIKEILGQ